MDECQHHQSELQAADIGEIRGWYALEVALATAEHGEKCRGNIEAASGETSIDIK